MSLPAGPNSCSNAAASNVSAATTSASAASWGVLNVLTAAAADSAVFKQTHVMAANPMTVALAEGFIWHSCDADHVAPSTASSAATAAPTGATTTAAAAESAAAARPHAGHPAVAARPSPVAVEAAAAERVLPSTGPARQIAAADAVGTTAGRTIAQSAARGAIEACAV